MRHHSRVAGRWSLLRAAAGFSTILLAASCVEAVLPFGATLAEARVNGRDVFAALSRRFNNVTRTKKFAEGRPKLAKGALTPSKVYDDTSVWTSIAPDSARVLTVGGFWADGRYVFNARTATPAITHTGDSRHVVRLKRVSGDQYEWQTAVDLGVGSVRAEQVASVFSALLRSTEGRAERDLRTDYRTYFSRSTDVLSRMFSLDSLHTIAAAGGGTLVTLGIGLHPERVRQFYPAFADYVDKYVVPSSYRIGLRDARGGRWFEAAAAKNRLTVRFRSLNGELVPIEGPARPMPDSLRIEGALSLHIFLFDVGLSDLTGDFVLSRGAHERAWDMRFARQPNWHLPLATRHLISAPLRRPFEQGGTTVHIAVHDSAGAQTILGRRLRLDVQESAILRWLGSLGNTAMNDFAGKSEVEENRFLSEIFGALSADVESAGTPHK